LETADLDPSIGEKDRRKIWTDWVKDPEQTSDERFLEATGKLGDVYLFHPLMLHSVSDNLRRDLRLITNHCISPKKPFNFDRANRKDYSLVKQKTLRELGRPEGLPGWKITREREMINANPVCVSKGLLL
jgi:hypothetical protein